ncbi:MAG: VanW family protein, partial [Desulfocucumaceae bacterium]
MLKFKKLSALFVIIILQTSLAIFIGGSFLSGGASGEIYPGVTAAGIDLGGMTPQKAEETLTASFNSVDTNYITLVGGERKWIIPLSSINAEYDYQGAVKSAFSVGHSGPFTRRISEMLGNKAVNTDVAMSVNFDMEALKGELQRINGEYSTRPQNARLIIEEGKIKFIPGNSGNEMDQETTLSNTLKLKAGSDFSVMISPKTVQPQIKDEDIADLTDLLGDCTTRFEAGSAGRVGNIARASGQIGGKLINPGEIFSFNAAISPVNQQNGYQIAPVIVGDQLVDDYGGGVCQVSTTIYGAVLLSGLEIVERHPHSKPVKYVSPGLDVTVADGILDFRFKNNLSRPVYIISSTEKDKGYVRITFAGKKEDSKVYRMETAIKTISPGVVLRGNSHLRR